MSSDLAAVVDKALADAKAGDAAARAWLSKYLLPADPSALPDPPVPEPAAFEALRLFVSAADPKLSFSPDMMAGLCAAMERHDVIKRARELLDRMDAAGGQP